MINLFMAYLANTLNISFFILLLLFAEPFLKKYYSTICLYRIWMVLLIGLLLPIRFEIIKPIFYLGSPRISVEAEADYDFNAAGFNDASYHTNDTDLSAQLTPYLWNAASDSSKSNITYFFKQLLSSKLPLIVQNRYFILFLLWMIGVIFLLTFNGVLYYRYKKRINRFLSPIDREDIMEAFNQSVMELCASNNPLTISGCSQCSKVILYHCSVITSPMTIGIFKPIILLPDKAYTKKDALYLLQHELIHVRRRDSLLKLVRLIALSLNWFNPLCYLMIKRMEYWCEASCDEIVLSQSTKSECMYYSELLLRYATAQSKQSSNLFNHFYGGKNNMKQRLLLILKRNNQCSGRIILALLFGIISTTAFFTANDKDVIASTDPKIVTDTTTDMTSPDETNVSGTAESSSAMPSITPNSSTAKDITATTSESVNDQSSNKAMKIGADEDNSSATSDADLLREKIVSYALETEGFPYLWGGTDLSTGVDSSGFVQTLYKKIGYDLPRLSMEQFNACAEISYDDLLPGDLVFYESTFSDTTIINHVGIYIGDGQIIHSSNMREGVKISDVNYRSPLHCGRVIT